MTGGLPSVSVVVPAYRQAGFITACLDSVAAQTYAGQVEVVVVDDGCPENSGDVAEAHRIAPTVIRQANAGVAQARNAGIAASQGELVAFLDADDRFHPDKLARQVARYRDAPGPALSFTRYRAVDDRGRPLGAVHPAERLKPSIEGLAQKNFIGCSTAMVDRVALGRLGGFPDSPALRRGGQDYALWLRLALELRLVYVPEVLTDYTVHESSRVGSDAVKNFLGAVYALDELGRTSGRLRDVVGRHRSELVARRAGDMFKDLVRTRAGGDAWLRAVRASWAARRTSWE